MSGNNIRSVAALLLLALALPPRCQADAVSIPPLSRSDDPDRTFVDIPLSPMEAPASAAALVVEFGSPVPADAVRSITLHLHSGNGWRSASLPTGRARGTVRLPFAAFSSPEGSPGPAAEADRLRISLWRLAPDSDTPPIAIPSAGFAPPANIAVVRATDATAPGETAFAADMAARLERILSRAGIHFDTIPDTALDKGSGTKSPSGASVVLLPYSPSLSSAHIDALRAHINANGRVIAFYNRSRALSALLGLAPPRYEHTLHGWTAMAWGERRIPHHTENLLVPVIKDTKDTTVTATWVDASGTVTNLPAIAVTPHGALFAHVPPMAFPAAQDLLRDLLGLPARETGSAPGASDQALPSFPIVGAWIPASRLPASIPPAINTLYPYLAAVPAPGAGGKAPRPSQAIHIWLPLLHPVDRPHATWLDPADPDTRGAVKRRVLAALRRRPAGIHFDYLRTSGGASPKATAAVTELLRDVAKTARDADPGIVLSAAVFPTPAAAAQNNQDWPAWLREGLLDYVVPMLYDDDPDAFRASLAQCLAVASPDRLVAGIGTGADEAQVDAAAFRAELEAAAAAHLRGVVFFPLDDALRELLPKK